MDCILGYHMNPLTCGVARFNRAIADQLELPLHHVFSDESLLARRPLLSFKASEMPQHALDRLSEICDRADVWPHLRLFFHDYSATHVEAKLVRRAEKIYCGNEVLTRELRALHQNVIPAWCPGYLFERREFDNNAEIKIYTFGMAHKLRTDYFYLLHDLLEQSEKSYVVYISAAIHEDMDLDDSFTSAYEELHQIFGDKVFFLGFVSDAALHAFLKTSTFFAAFFQNGVRANNSSVNTAMQCGAVVLTNLDEDSPAEFRHLESVVDIRQCSGGLPVEPELLERIGRSGMEAAGRLGWGPLLDLFAREEAAVSPAVGHVATKELTTKEMERHEGRLLPFRRSRSDSAR
jgi:hypothetical protein